MVPLGDFMISYSSLGEFREASVIWVVSRRFYGFPPSKLPLPFVCSNSSYPTKGIFSMHPLCVAGEMHRTLSMEKYIWSSFDQFWAVFEGELLGNDVISWPWSFRVWNNTFRGLRALGLWTYVIGVAVPKYVYNSGGPRDRKLIIFMSQGVFPNMGWSTSIVELVMAKSNII